MEENTNQGNPVKQAVLEKYSNLAEKQANAQESTSCRTSGGCCTDSSSRLAEQAAEIYHEGDFNSLPSNVTNISLGCGNPTAIAKLAPGQTVLDLGSGGGIDCFLAAEKVGPEGRVIGLDMTPKMLDLARSNAKKMGVQNVEFRYGYLEDIPLPDATADVIISNCVINLAVDKDPVFREAFRVLKLGGVMNISDVVTYGSLPAALLNQLSAWAGCVAGALDEKIYLGKMRKAGFEKIEITERRFYPLEQIIEIEGVGKLLEENRLDMSELEHKIASITLRAEKGKQ